MGARGRAMIIAEREQVARAMPHCFVMCSDVLALDRDCRNWRRQLARHGFWRETGCADCGAAVIYSDRVPSEPMKVCIRCSVLRVRRAGSPSPLRVLDVTEGLLRE